MALDNLRSVVWVNMRASETTELLLFLTLFYTVHRSYHFWNMVLLCWINCVLSVCTGGEGGLCHRFRAVCFSIYTEALCGCF